MSILVARNGQGGSHGKDKKMVAGLGSCLLWPLLLVVTTRKEQTDQNYCATSFSSRIYHIYEGKWPKECELGQGQEDLAKGAPWFLACHEWCIEWGNATKIKWEQSHFPHSWEWSFWWRYDFFFKCPGASEDLISEITLPRNLMSQVYLASGKQGCLQGGKPPTFWHSEVWKSPSSTVLPSPFVVVVFWPRESAWLLLEI